MVFGQAVRSSALPQPIEVAAHSAVPLMSSASNPRFFMLERGSLAKLSRSIAPAFDGVAALVKPLEAELLIAQLKRCISNKGKANGHSAHPLGAKV